MEEHGENMQNDPELGHELEGKEATPEEQVKNLYDEQSVDISLPSEILMPEPPQKEEVKEIKDECDVAFKFGFVGAGQGGSRIAETFHRLGYRKIAAINTAQQDLNTINLENKLCIGAGGAGKNPAYAEKVFSEKREDTLDFLRYSFGESLDRIFICAGAGGGTGAGLVCPLVSTAKEIQETIGAPTNKVGVILALPKKSEGKKVNENAFLTLSKVWKLVEDGSVSPLIILDNEKIGQLYPNLVVSNFWQTANNSLAGLFHLFNLISARDSSYSSFDAKDYRTLLDSGLMVFGASPVKNWEDPISISRAIRENLQNNILSGGVDLNTGSCGAGIIIGGKEQLDQIKQSSIDQAFEQITRMLKPGNMVHRGIYVGDKKDLTIFTAIAGLGSPDEKLKELSKLGDLK